jgi:hypothetical protein
MPSESHTIMDGKVHVYRRENSRFWQCAVYLGGRNHRATTRQERLVLAIDFARDWYMERYADERLRRRGVPLPTNDERESGDVAAALVRTRKRKPKPAPKGPTFREAAKAFVAEYQVITHGERNAEYVAGKSRQLDLHLLPFFGDKPVTEVTAGLIQEYRVHRVTATDRTADKKSPLYWNPRTAYSLRHTYICMRLMEGADIYQIAKNCRTSVEMIEKFYASHIKNTLDAAAINVRKKPKPRKEPSAQKALANA